MHDKRPLWILSGIIVGIGITLTLNTAICGLKGFKTPEQKQIMIEKHEKGLTLEKLEKRITKNTKEIEKLKEELIRSKKWNNEDMIITPTITDVNN